MKTCLILLVAIAVSLAAAELPPLVLPAGVGVNIHFNRGHTADLDRIAEAGFKFVRMDLGWESIERERGRYDWSAYDELLANFQARGLRAILILDYSNPLYEAAVASRNPVFGGEQKATGSPQHPESVAAFARWAAAAVGHFKGRGVVWEIWNEPNISFWKPAPDVHQYSDLAIATGQAVRAADPRATLIGPATSEIPLKFLEDFLASGALEYLDAVSVHPYRDYHRAPETALPEYARLRTLIARYTPPGRRPPPLISGEWGYATHTKGVSPETQAAYLVRQQLANVLDGVPISIWYDWKNDGADPGEREHNFGTVLPDLTSKPAYRALQIMTRELRGYRIARRLVTDGAQDYVLLCQQAHQPDKLAAWTLAAPHAVAIEAKLGRNATLRGMTGSGVGFGLDAAGAGAGEHARLRQDGGRLWIELEAAPIYLTLTGVQLPRAKTSP